MKCGSMRSCRRSLENLKGLCRLGDRPSSSAAGAGFDQRLRSGRVRRPMRVHVRCDRVVDLEALVDLIASVASYNPERRVDCRGERLKPRVAELMASKPPPGPP